jgi:hypothetical protein
MSGIMILPLEEKFKSLGVVGILVFSHCSLIIKTCTISNFLK